MASRRRTPLSEDQFLLAEVAQLYYVGDFTQAEISRRIGTSRSNVSRMLKEAREQGMVEVRIHSPLRTVPGLQEELVSRLGLGSAWCSRPWTGTPTSSRARTP